jgi:transcription initiation factor TFIID subunit 10
MADRMEEDEGEEVDAGGGSVHYGAAAPLQQASAQPGASNLAGFAAIAAAIPAAPQPAARPVAQQHAQQHSSLSNGSAAPGRPVYRQQQQQQQQQQQPSVLTPLIITRRKRERELGDFLTALDKYSPTLPEPVTRHYLQKGGAGTSDERLVKLISLAADRFIATAIVDACAYQHARLGGPGGDFAAPAPLELCDLAAALKERGIALHEFSQSDAPNEKRQR